MVALVVLTVTSGCLATDPVAETPATTTSAIGEANLTFSATFKLHIGPDPEVAAFGGISNNCVFFWDTDGAQYANVTGSATLTWDPLPSTQSLRLHTTGATDERAAGPGGSPLTISFENLLVPDGRWGIGFWVDYSLFDPAFPIEQDAELALSFVYSGALPEPGVGTCAGGGV